MRIFGVLCLVLGLILLGCFALIFDTSVAGVNNLGLIADRTAGVIAGAAFMTIGAIFLATAELKQAIEGKQAVQGAGRIAGSPVQIDADIVDHIQRKQARGQVK